MSETEDIKARKMSETEDINDAIAPAAKRKTAPRRGISRRAFVRRLVAYIGGLSGLLSSLAIRRASSQTPSDLYIPGQSEPYDYIVVGSGAGGGSLACNLAKAGFKVVLIEAGGGDGDDLSSVPLFHPLVTEDPRVRWDYYVRHYTDEERQRRDSKYIAEQGGVYYPRAGTLGGCTVHSAMVMVYPNNEDWDDIAEITGDPSWRAENMRQYFERIEQCGYVPRPQGRNNPTRHGFDGWLSTEIADPMLFARDSNLQRILREAARAVEGNEGVLDAYFGKSLDPNDWRINSTGNLEGLYNFVLSTRNGRRRGPRDLIRETAAALPNNLIVKTHALVSRVLFKDRTAIGVEYLDGAHLYRADPLAQPNVPEPPRQQIFAAREVILAAGAFNTPQILKLSGIGAADELRRHGIEAIVDLPGVGENLQDRYEISVVTKMNSDFTLTQECKPGQQSDPCFAQWQQGQGIYTSNYNVIGYIQKSSVARQKGRSEPDLFVIGAAAPFTGYYPGYSRVGTQITNQFTWALLKAHTRNRAGSVILSSTDPRDRPEINFRYFVEGDDTAGEDLEAMIEGVEFVRRMNSQIQDISQGEVVPGATVQSREEVGNFIANEAWGHHASCTSKIGRRDDPMAVIDGDFCVYGTRNLRIVDASVFPRIPGYFPLVAIYMVSEKASDAIIASARQRKYRRKVRK